MTEDKLKDEYLNTLEHYGNVLHDLFDEWHQHFVRNELDKCDEILDQIKTIQDEEDRILDDLERKLDIKK